VKGFFFRIFVFRKFRHKPSSKIWFWIGKKQLFRNRENFAKQWRKYYETRYTREYRVFLKIWKNDCEQCFSTFFCLRHPVRQKKIWWHPFLAKMTSQGTLSSKKPKKVVNSIFGGTPDPHHQSNFVTQRPSR